MSNLKKAIAVAICASSVTAGGVMAQPPVQPNFVTIVIDDMGYSDLGIFGGEAQTPHLDALAADGVILTNFYAGATSSPSRGMLYSGKDNHKAGMGAMRESLRDEVRGQPGYEGVLSLETLPFPQILQDNTYHTMMVGKWHMGGNEENEDAYYAVNRGFTETRALLLPGGDLGWMTDDNGTFMTEHGSDELMGRTSLYNDNGVESDLTNLPPNTHSTNYYTDKAIEMLDSWAAGTTQPFYLNMAYVAPHAPWQAPQELVDKYADAYAVGWEKIHEQRFNNLKELGYLPQHVELTAMSVEPWDSLSERRKQFEARRMAVYTAEIDLLDQNVGRLVQDLKDKGAYDNTVFFVYSDNGAAVTGFASAEVLAGIGLTNHNAMAGQLDSLSDAEFQQVLDDLGGTTSFIGPIPAWGPVAGTPFRGNKGDGFDGGTRGAAFVHYPQAMATGISTNCLYSVMDIAPTVLEMAGIQYPSMYNGKPNEPMDGISMAGIFEGRLLCNPERWIGFELDGVKALRQGNWKLGSSWSSDALGLYNVWKDPFESNDLSALYPTKLEEMMGLYQQYASENSVIEVNPLHLPELADPDLTSAKIRGGTAAASPPLFHLSEASFAPMTQVSIAGEIRPASEHVGMTATIFARVSYSTPELPEPAYFWFTKPGDFVSDNGSTMVPFMADDIVFEASSMVLIPFYTGVLPEEADIEFELGYMLPDGTIISNDVPMTITLNNE